MSNNLAEKEILDGKIFELIEACKINGNYKKIAVVGFLLISNLVDEIGIKLGIRPRNKDYNELIYKYLTLINKFLMVNLKINLFKQKKIDNLKKIETPFLESKGNLRDEQIKDLYSIYYYLRTLKIPSLHEPIEKEDINVDLVPEIRLHSFLYSSEKRSKNNDPGEKIKPLILDKIRQKEKLIQKINREKGYNSKLFSDAIQLKILKNSFKEDGEKKITLSEGTPLKASLNYQRTLNDIVGYSFLGVFIVFFGLGLLILVEAMLFPRMTLSFSILFIICFGPAMLFIFCYWYFFRRET